jgi:hypothetical protein
VTRTGSRRRRAGHDRYEPAARPICSPRRYRLPRHLVFRDWRQHVFGFLLKSAQSANRATPLGSLFSISSRAAPSLRLSRKSMVTLGSRIRVRRGHLHLAAPPTPFRAPQVLPAAPYAAIRGQVLDAVAGSPIIPIEFDRGSGFSRLPARADAAFPSLATG